MSEKEPIWLTRLAVDAIHDDQLRSHGGASGILNEGSVESALARARQKFAYGTPDVYACAAAYLYGFAKNHGYQDANKRTAYMAARTFLRMNGISVRATPHAIIDLMLDVATDRCDEVGIADWLRAHTT